jgi:hypothetical protein
LIFIIPLKYSLFTKPKALQSKTSGIAVEQKRLTEDVFDRMDVFAGIKTGSADPCASGSVPSSGTNIKLGNFEYKILLIC